ncbi:MAG TPA: amidohydrolase family protein, partial [Longimicrobiales bacterium]|nr:amidohydrolase family protein [Longimicrobiales bacterium]
MKIMRNLRMATSPAALCGGVLVLLAATTSALEAQIPAPRQDRPIALTGATIHTVTNGTIQNGTILFEDGKIIAIGTNVQIPTHAERIDATGKHIYPGLVDAHNVLGMFEIGGIDVTIDVNELGDFNPNVRAHVAVNPESRHLGVARSNGVLVSVSSPSGGIISGHSSAMMLDGWTWEQMTLKPETGLIVNWPNMGGGGFGGGGFGGGGGGGGRNPQQIYDDNVRSIRDFFADSRAYHASRRAAPERHNTDVRFEAMDGVLNGTTPVLVVANELRQIQDAITWAEQEGVRMVLVGGRDAGYVAPLLAQRNIPVLLSSVLTSPNRQWEPYDKAYALPAELHAAGVQFGITGGTSAAYANRLPYEAGAAIAYGLPEDVALQAVTMNPARFLGFEDRVGSLEVGKDATLLITTGNPLEYSTEIEQAFIQGRMIDMEDAHRRFFEKYSEKLRQLQGQPI